MTYAKMRQMSIFYGYLIIKNRTRAETVKNYHPQLFRFYVTSRSSGSSSASMAFAKRM